MLTLLEFRAPEPTGDSKKDYLQLVAAISAHFRKLNDKDVLMIQQGAIDSTPIGANDPSTGKFTTLQSTGNTTLGDASGDTLTIAPNAVTWSNNPTHSGNHTFSGSVTVNGDATLCSDGSDQVTVNADLVDFATASTRIKGDFSNATLGTRTLFQTRTTNGASDVGAISDGSGTASAWSAYGGSDPANASLLQIIASTTAALLRNTKTGTGTQQALEMQIGSTTRFGIETDGRLYGTAMHNTGTVTGTAKNYLASGTYTPTFTNVANCDSFTARQAQWMRVGNVVTVSGQVSTDFTTAATASGFRISLPIASDFADAYDCAGAAVCNTTAIAGTRTPFSVQADSTNNEAYCEGEATNNATTAMWFTFTYEIL